MSMISSLIDELNNSADEWNSSNMFELARMCRDAADTIWQLRDDLQRANAENAKLRELVEELWTYTEQVLICDENCSYGAVCDWRDCVYERRMHDLGVEVPDGD